eukprot:2027423-Prymnesium_polylepis.1
MLRRVRSRVACQDSSRRPSLLDLESAMVRDFTSKEDSNQGSKYFRFWVQIEARANRACVATQAYGAPRGGSGRYAHSAVPWLAR